MHLALTIATSTHVLAVVFYPGSGFDSTQWRRWCGGPAPASNGRCGHRDLSGG